MKIYIYSKNNEDDNLIKTYDLDDVDQIYQEDRKMYLLLKTGEFKIYHMSAFEWGIK